MNAKEYKAQRDQAREDSVYWQGVAQEALEKAARLEEIRKFQGENNLELWNENYNLKMFGRPQDTKKIQEQAEEIRLQIEDIDRLASDAVRLAVKLEEETKLKNARLSTDLEWHKEALDQYKDSNIELENRIDNLYEDVHVLQVLTQDAQSHQESTLLAYECAMDEAATASEERDESRTQLARIKQAAQKWNRNGVWGYQSSGVNEKRVNWIRDNFA